MSQHDVQMDLLDRFNRAVTSARAPFNAQAFEKFKKAAGNLNQSIDTIRHQILQAFDVPASFAPVFPAAADPSHQNHVHISVGPFSTDPNERHRLLDSAMIQEQIMDIMEGR